MATFVNDTFTDTAGTLIPGAHTGETGATWTRNTPSTVDTFHIDSNELWAGSSDIMVYASGTPASADYTVQADFHMVTAAITSTFICARLSTTAATFYGLRHVGTSGGNWELFKRVAGTFTAFGTYTDSTMVAGATVTAQLKVTGSTIDAIIAGTNRITQTDSSITTADKAGLRSSSAETASTGIHIDNFSAFDPVATSVVYPKSFSAIPVQARGRNL